MNWSDFLTDANRNLAKFRKAQPDEAAGFSAMAKAAMQPGALSTKDKELMCIAVGISKQCNDCIGFHIKAAVAAGATRDEVAETISVAMYMGGGPAFMYGARALEAFDQFTA